MMLFYWLKIPFGTEPFCMHYAPRLFDDIVRINSIQKHKPRFESRHTFTCHVIFEQPFCWTQAQTSCNMQASLRIFLAMWILGLLHHVLVSLWGWTVEISSLSHLIPSIQFARCVESVTFMSSRPTSKDFILYLFSAILYIAQLHARALSDSHWACPTSQGKWYITTVIRDIVITFRRGLRQRPEHWNLHHARSRSWLCHLKVWGGFLSHLIAHVF